MALQISPVFRSIRLLSMVQSEESIDSSRAITTIVTPTRGSTQRKNESDRHNRQFFVPTLNRIEEHYRFAFKITMNAIPLKRSKAGTVTITTRLSVGINRELKRTHERARMRRNVRDEYAHGIRSCDDLTTKMTIVRNDDADFAAICRNLGQSEGYLTRRLRVILSSSRPKV